MRTLFLVAIRGLFGLRRAVTAGSVAEHLDVRWLMSFDSELRGRHVIAFA